MPASALSSNNSALSRRTFLRLSVAASAGSLVGCAAHLREDPGARQASKVTPVADIDRFNYILGTQSIGATYQFTNETLLVETARATLDLGSNVLKLTLGRDYRRMVLTPSKSAYPETMQYLLNQGSDAQTALRVKFPGAAVTPPPADPAIRSLVDLARLEPSYRRVFGMPFAYYFVWTYAFSPRWWNRGFPPEEQEKEYREFYDLTAYLLKTYNGTGKTFYLGHWEGDWHLRPDLNTSTDDGLKTDTLQGMTDWLNTRQRAVDDAKRRTRHRDVQVYHYTEANHVSAIAVAGRPCLTNRVLPYTNVDFVSYSTYDSLDDVAHKIPNALDYIESKLHPKPGFPGKRVFIGEYGFAARSYPEAERDRRSREVMRVGVEWGCPFVLSWAMYNNEYKDDIENGYWLIDDKATKQPVWHTLADYYRDARRYVADTRRSTGRSPSEADFRRFALDWLKR